MAERGVAWNERELRVLADRVRVLRKTLGLSQVKFANQIGVTESTVNKVERGKIRASQRFVYRIKMVYGVDLSENLDDESWVPSGDLSLKISWSEIRSDEMEALPPITRRIYELMKKRNITQRELAESIGLTTATINAWKQNRRTPNSDVIMPICRVLNVTPYYLLEGKDE